VSEFATLHPYDPAFVARYVAAVRGEIAPAELVPPAPAWAEQEIARARRGYARALERQKDEAAVNAISLGLARMLAVTQPVFFVPDMGFTQIEARFDRGLGMLLRPPSRLFLDAGLDTSVARTMPIRIDASGGSMGGAFLPPALTEQFRDHLEARMDRLARRMAEAEMDAPAYIGQLLDVAAYVTANGLGLYEASDVFVPGMLESQPPGIRLLQPDRKRLPKELRVRLEEATRPPREPGLIARLLGRGRATPAREDMAWDEPRVWRGVNDVTPPPERHASAASASDEEPPR
jgi:hypothetical protein